MAIAIPQFIPELCDGNNWTESPRNAKGEPFASICWKSVEKFPSGFWYQTSEAPKSGCHEFLKMYPLFWYSGNVRYVAYLIYAICLFNSFNLIWQKFSMGNEKRSSGLDETKRPLEENTAHYVRYVFGSCLMNCRKLHILMDTHRYIYIISHVLPKCLIYVHFFAVIDVDNGKNIW